MSQRADGATMELITERLRMVPISDVHLDALHEVWTDPDVRLYLWSDQVLTRSQAAALVAASERSFTELGFGFWALLLAESQTLIGFCGFRRFEDSDQPELLYGILPAHWGNGYVTEAGRAALTDLFERLSPDRALAATDTPNQSSVRVLQRLGMFFVERREYQGLDTVFYALTRDEYAEAKAEP